MNDPYATLGVARDATQAQIRAAWKLLSQRNHPDRGGDPKRAAEINEAWTCLSDETRRLRYDADGKDVPIDSNDVEARKMLHDMFNAAIGNDRVIDLVGFVKRELVNVVRNLTQGISEHQILIKRLAKKRARVRSKQADNIAHRLIDQRVREANAAIEHMLRGITVAGVAQALIEDYEFVPEETIHDVWLNYSGAMR